MTDTPMVQPLRDFGGWLLAGRCMVKDRAPPHQLVPLVPNLAQRRIYASWMAQAQRGLPIRTIVPKRRKGGVSTIVQAALRFFAKYVPLWSSMTVAHTKESVGEIFEIARLIHAHDGGDAPAQTSINFPESHGSYVCRTALGAFTGSGGNLNGLHISELAKMQRQAGGDTTALASLVSAVPQFSPMSMIVIEATGQGPSGEFYMRCLEAAADPQADYALVFLPWFEDPSYSLAEVPAGFKLTEYEEEIGKGRTITPNQWAWRRKMLRTEYAGKEIEFKWDYPSTLEEAFEAAAGRMLPLFNRSQHVKTLKETDLEKKLKGSYVVLGIDFGAGPSPFVCLWLRVFPGEKPGFTVDPSCVNAIREFMAWSRDPKTGKPMDEAKHCPDACRYPVSTLRLDGHVHIYREMYVMHAARRGETHLTLGREVLRLSKGEGISQAVCDRAEPLTINDLLMLGIPAQPYEKLPGALGDSDIEQGAKRMLALMAGTSWFYDSSAPALAEARAKMRSPAPDGRERDVRLTEREERALEDDRERRLVTMFGTRDEL